ncbi:MAG: DUF3810 domain-containing protein [Coprococcus sp.]
MLHKRKGISKYWRFIIIYFGVILFLNVMARWQAFCDFYVEHIFGIWVGTYGRFTGLFPFSVGEILIMLGVVIVLAAIIFAICLIFLRKKEKYKHFCFTYFKSLLVILLSVILVLTLNCTMLYNCTRLEVYGVDGKEASSEETDINNLVALRNYIVNKCNELAVVVERDDNGEIIYSVDLHEELSESFVKLSGQYPRLAGYCPKAKPIMSSYFMYQANLLGVYFPFSLEANYNKYLSSSYKASIMAHELSHLKGYIYEDEANFIAFLACIESDDPAVQYSGYLSVLDYIEFDAYDAVYDAYGQTDFFDAAYEKAFMGIEPSERVMGDNVCMAMEAMETLLEETPIIDTEIVSNASEVFTESYLDYYGAEANYDEVTLLMLKYYEGILY